MPVTPVKKFKKVRKAIRDKVKGREQLTPKQKLEALKEARALLETNYGRDAWVKLIGGVERFCMYGAMEKVLDLPPRGQSDQYISTCSLTSTLFDAAPDCKAKQEVFEADGKYANQQECSWRNSLNRRKNYLQKLNDSGDKRKVLRVFDRAIKKLEAEV